MTLTSRPQITAARLLGHKSINGKYQTRMQMDDFPVLGHQMTHSIDSYITDSANSASALYSGHKSTVNAMGFGPRHAWPCCCCPLADMARP